jgi:hypothetical protein
MIPQKAIKKFTKPAHREIVVGHLVAYGFFPQTSDGIDQAKKFVDGLDQWLAPSDLPNYYDGIESDLMTGNKTAGIVNITMLMEQFYFSGGATEETKEIPVEVEVVEVEQKTVDEPIVVTIEAPFEPAPTAPKSPARKRIRLPRRSGIIPATPRTKKKSVAERMADAFDARLDDLVESVQNPSPPTPPKKRKQKDSLAKIRKAVKPKINSTLQESRNVKPFENTGLFLFNKTRNAFRRAAVTRRMANQMGMPQQEKGFYVKRALGFEFGGDAIARTRGTFSSSPDATLDPSLTKQQRFTSGLFGTRTIRKPQEQRIDNEIDGITKKISEIDKKFDSILKTKSEGSDGTEGTATLEKTLEELKKKLQSGNKLQKDVNVSKNKLLSLESKAADQAQAAAEEAQIDKGEDLSGFEDMYQPSEKEGSAGDEEEGGGFDWFDKLKKFKAGKWLRRLKNPGRFLRSIGRLNRMRVARFLRPAGNLMRGAGQIGSRLATGAKGIVTGGAAATAAIVAGAGLAASGIGEGFFQLTKKGGAGEQTRDFLKKKGEETGGPLGMMYGAMGNMAGISTEATKVTGNALDAIGAPFRYAIEGIRYPFLNEEDRKKQADNLAKFDARIREYSRGWMNRIDFMNIVPDEKGGFGNMYGNNDAQKDMMEKMSEGGTIPEPKFQSIGGARLTGDLPTTGPTVMAGEAGNEMLVTPESNPLQSLAPMIVAMREVTKRAGTWADPVENMVRQITDPIAKKIGLPTLPATIDIGQNIPDGKQGEQGGGLKGEKKGLLGKLMDFLKGKSSGSTATSPAATPFAGDPNMGGGAGTTTAGAVYNYLLSKGMSENHAKGITANISRESGFKLGAHNPNDPGAGSFGLFQWNGGRAQNMMAAVPDWQTNWQGQIDYALGEDHGPTYLSTQFGSAGEAAYDWMKYWERPAAYVQAKYTPAAYEGMINKMGLHRGMPVAPPAPAAAPPTPASQNQAKTASENRRMGRDAAKRKQEAAATAPAQPPTTPAPVPATSASTGTVLLPLVFPQPGGGGQQAAPALPLPTTSTGEIDWMKMTRQQRLGAS